MRVQVSVNDGAPVRASLTSNGWLSVHLNFQSDNQAESSSGSIQAVSIDCSNEPNSVHSVWDIGKMAVGDKAEIHVVADGEADPPTEVKRSIESPSNLFSNTDEARRLLKAISACDKELNAVIEQSHRVEPEDEFRKILIAIGGILAELDHNLIQPTLRRHPELLAEAQEMRLFESSF